MPRIIIKYDDSTGEILRWRPVGADDLNPDKPEFEADVDRPTEVFSKKVDTSTDPPTLFTPAKQKYHDTKSNNDIEGMADALFELVTGEKP